MRHIVSLAFATVMPFFPLIALADSAAPTSSNTPPASLSAKLADGQALIHDAHTLINFRLREVANNQQFYKSEDDPLLGIPSFIDQARSITNYLQSVSGSDQNHESARTVTLASLAAIRLELSDLNDAISRAKEVGSWDDGCQGNVNQLKEDAKGEQELSQDTLTTLLADPDFTNENTALDDLLKLPDNTNFGASSYTSSPLRIIDVQPGSLAEQIGLASGDTIVSIAGSNVTDLTNAATSLQQHTGAHIQMVVLRANQQTTLYANVPSSFIAGPAATATNGSSIDTAPANTASTPANSAPNSTDSSSTTASAGSSDGSISGSGSAASTSAATTASGSDSSSTAASTDSDTASPEPTLDLKDLNPALLVSPEDARKAISKGKDMAKHGKQLTDVYASVTEMPRGIKGKKGRSHQSSVVCMSLNGLSLVASALDAVNNYEAMDNEDAYEKSGTYMDTISFAVSLVSINRAESADVDVRRFVLTDDKNDVLTPSEDTSSGVKRGTRTTSGVTAYRTRHTAHVDSTSTAHAYGSDGSSADGFGSGESTVTYTTTQYVPWTESHPYYEASYSVSFPMFDASGKPTIALDAKHITLHIITPNGEKDADYDLNPPKF